MKKLIIFLFPLFLMATYLFDFDKNFHFDGICLSYRKLPVSCSSNNIDFFIDGSGYQCLSYADSSGWNMQCVQKNYPRLTGQECGFGTHYYYFVNDTFCKSKPGYFYDPSSNAWFPTSSNNNSPICPDGYEYSKSQSKCISLNDCSSGLTLYNGQCITPKQLLKQLLTSQDYQFFQKDCHFVNHSVFINGQDLCTADLYCDGKYLKSIQVSCGKSKSSNSDVNSSSVNENNKPLICGPDKAIVIDSDGNVSCVDENITIPKSVNSSNKDYNISNNVNSSNVNQNENVKSELNQTNSNGNSSTSLIDCCARYKNPQLGDSWVLVSSNVWKLSGGSCEITIKDGNCSVITSTDVNSSSGSNSLLLNISSKIANTNSKLDSIDKDVKDLINAKPSTQPSSELSSDTKSFLSGFSDTISNIKNIVSNLKSSADQVKTLLQNPKKVTLFSNSNVETCPVDFTLYGQVHSFDVCKIVSPYRPFVQLFFTIFFSISVLLYFIDIIMRSK